MSKDILREKIKSLVAPMFDEYMHPAKGTVVDYSHVGHAAHVVVDNPQGTGKIDLAMVPVHTTRGVKSAGLRKGDTVWVTFLNGKLSSPRITATADEDYAYNTRAKALKHKKQGAFVPQILGKR